MISNKQKTVTVFKTNVLTTDSAQAVLGHLSKLFPLHRINFDLDDCDRILRIEGLKINCALVIEQLKQNNFSCELLEVVV
jgi:hypothetical protein